MKSKLALCILVIEILAMNRSWGKPNEFNANSIAVQPGRSQNKFAGEHDYSECHDEYRKKLLGLNFPADDSPWDPFTKDYMLHMRGCLGPKRFKTSIDPSTSLTDFLVVIRLRLKETWNRSSGDEKEKTAELLRSLNRAFPPAANAAIGKPSDGYR